MTPVLLALAGSPAGSLIVKVTVTTVLALLCAWLARNSRAAVRHAVLAGAFGVLLLLPVASLLVPPVRIAVAVAAPRPAELRDAAEPVPMDPPPSQRDSMAGIPPVVAPAFQLTPAALCTGVWLAGVIATLFPLLIGLRQVRALRRCGLPWMEGQRVADRLALDAGMQRRVQVLLDEAVGGPMTCGVLRPAIVLPADAEAWEPADLERAVVHELEHVRRGDWASQLVSRAICSVYWFHPLVWMAWRQLALEAERSCDDAVLGHSDPTAYAEQLVALARRLLAAKSPLLAMATRTDLAVRVGAVLDVGQRRGRAGALAVGLACGSAAVLVLAVSPLTTVAAPQAAPPQFDAVSVKLVDANIRGSHSSEKGSAVRLVTSGTMHRFIIRSYGITEGQLDGEPAWFNTHQYSIEAVSSKPVNDEQKMLMLRAVLADRFQLQLRQEERDLPVYALEVAPGGPKFKPLKPGETVQDGKEPPGYYARSFTSVTDLMNTLNGVFGGRLSVGRTVVDHTNLGGSYNMQLLTEIEVQTDDFGQRTMRFPNLASDIQSQLGLKLTAARVKMPHYTVEHAAFPTPN